MSEKRKNAILASIFGVAAIFAVKAIDVSPLRSIFNGRWWIPLGGALLLIIFGEKIARWLSGED